jgi:hypothetical protein
VQAAIAGGHYTPPEGLTVEAMVASIEFRPIGTLSLIGAHDVEPVQGEGCERGWVTNLSGAA